MWYSCKVVKNDAFLFTVFNVVAKKLRVIVEIYAAIIVPSFQWCLCLSTDVLIHHHHGHNIAIHLILEGKVWCQHGD